MIVSRCMGGMGIRMERPSRLRCCWGAVTHSLVDGDERGGGVLRWMLAWVG